MKLIGKKEAVTTETATVLNIKDLFEADVLIKGELSNFAAPGFYIEGSYTDDKKCVDIWTPFDEAEQHQHIEIVEVPSNLGAGAIPYFVCPDTVKRCRKLYVAYGSHRFLSREAYAEPIYYLSQIVTALERHLKRYTRLLDEYEKLKKSKRGQKSYNGKLTRHHVRLEQKKEEIAAAKKLKEKERSLKISKFMEKQLLG